MKYNIKNNNVKVDVSIVILQEFINILYPIFILKSDISCFVELTLSNSFQVNLFTVLREMNGAIQYRDIKQMQCKEILNIINTYSKMIREINKQKSK